MPAPGSPPVRMPLILSPTRAPAAVACCPEWQAGAESLTTHPSRVVERRARCLIVPTPYNLPLPRGACGAPAASAAACSRLLEAVSTSRCALRLRADSVGHALHRRYPSACPIDGSSHTRSRTAIPSVDSPGG